MLTVPVPIITVLVINTLLLFRIRFYRYVANIRGAQLLILMFETFTTKQID